ncbi:MAG: hypothetical protein J1E35_05490 [Lachnospiraceae bacterium]|nr:hypothetical protein [Lachnospiraceae bacterium]
MNGIHTLFGDRKPDKAAELQRSATTAGKDTPVFAAQTAKEGGKTDITVSVSEGAVGNVEEEICYGDVSKNRPEEEETQAAQEEEEKTLEETAEQLTEEDYDALCAEGVTVEELTATELSRAIERIRLGRELKAENLENQKAKLEEKRKSVIEIAKKALKGNPAAEYIAEKLLAVGVPVTEATVNKVYQAVEFAGKVSEMTESMQYYMIKFEKEPTIENVYLAQYSAGNVKSTPVSEAIWERLTVSANQVCVNAGLPITEENISNARWLTEHGLPITGENLIHMRQLNDVKKRTPEEVAELAAGALLDGKQAIKASLTALTKTEVGERVERMQGFTPDTVERAYVRKAAQKVQEMQPGQGVPEEDVLGRAMQQAAKEDVTFNDLAFAEDELKSDTQPDTLEQAVLKEVSGFSMDFDISVVRAKRRLEEIRLKMTTESAYRLERQGIRIDTSGLAKVVDGLRILENNYYRYYTDEAGISGNRSMEEMFRRTMQNLDSLSKSPSYTLGVTFENRRDVTLEALSAAGSSLGAKMQRAGELYDMLGTRPQSIYGDSINNAFAGNADLLKSMGMEASPENMRAVRILAYNSIELNEDNITAVKEYDRKVTELVEGMHPAAALRLIREGINPLTETVDALSQRVAEIRMEDGLENDKEKFARYLFKVEKNAGVTPEERSAYIGMFRLFNQLEKTDGAAIGAVMESGRELTLGNLLSAMRTAKTGGIDVTADENLGKIRQLLPNSSKIDSQILSGIKISGKVADISVSDGYEFYKEGTVRTEEETAQAVRDLRANAETAAQAPEFLKGLGLVVTANNVEAAKEFLAGTGEMYGKLGQLLKNYQTDTESESSETDSEADALLSAGGVDSTESLFDVRVAEGFYRSLKKSVRNLEDVMYAGEPTSVDIKALKQIKMGVKLRGECAGKECFDFPIETSEGLKSMRVTLQTESQTEEGGRATVKIPLVKLGNVQADLHMEDNRIFCFVSSDSREGTGLIEHSKRELTERLLDLGVSDALVYCGTGARSEEYTVNRIPGIDKEGDVTEPQRGEKPDTAQLLAASKAVFVHIMEIEQA